MAFGQARFQSFVNGTQVTIQLFWRVYEILGIENLFTAMYHPQINGQVERYNLTVIAMLRFFSEQNSNNCNLQTTIFTFG